MATASGLFKRDHHQRVAQLLQHLNADFLHQAQCYFGGGTAPVLLLNEYRESVDVDLLCASQEGYRLLRNTVSSQHLGEIIQGDIHYMREVRSDQYGIRTFIKIDNVAIKFEIIREARIPLSGELSPTLGVPVLSKIDLIAEKLLANTDRGGDKSTYGRDLIDLAMMAWHWKGIPKESWEKAESAYGASCYRAFQQHLNNLINDPMLSSHLRTLKVNENTYATIAKALQALTAEKP